MERIPDDAKDVITQVYNTSISGIEMALALTVALAWYSFVKVSIQNIYPTKFKGETWWMYLLFAVIITVIFAVVIFAMKKYMNYNGRTPIAYAVTPGMINMTSV